MRVVAPLPLRPLGPLPVAASALAAVAGGTAAAFAPAQLVAGAMVAVIVVAVVARHPPAAVYVLLAATPLLAGLERGRFVPELRPHEILGLLVGAGVLVHVVGSVMARARPRIGFVPGRVDAAVVLLAVAGSVIPLAIMLQRDRDIAALDLLYAAQVWKYLALFFLVRLTIRTPAQVLTCLWVTLAASVLVAVYALAQVLPLPATELRTVVGTLNGLFAPDEVNFAQRERGSSSLASSIAVGDVMTFSVAIAAGLFLTGDRRAMTLLWLTGLFVLGTVATGQFSAIVALAVGLLAFGWVTGRLGKVVLLAAPAALAAGIVLRGVIEARLSGFEGGRSLPAGWQVRLDNVTTHFLPPLGEDLNWLSGVRPLGRIDGPRFSGIEFIWIESGYVYLLWTGGLAFLLAFLWFEWTALRAVRRVARERRDAVGVAAAASFAALAVVGVLMVLDPHITLRGSADLTFALLALALVGQGARSQKPGWSQGRAARRSRTWVT